MHGISHPNTERAMKWGPRTHSDDHTWDKPQFSKVPQMRWILVGDPDNPLRRFERQVRERTARKLWKSAIQKRDRVTMWVNRGVPKMGVDTRLQPFRKHVFEHFRLRMNFLPGIAEGFHQEQLHQAVMPEHFERQMLPNRS